MIWVSDRRCSYSLAIQLTFTEVYSIQTALHSSVNHSAAKHYKASTSLAWSACEMEQEQNILEWVADSCSVDIQFLDACARLWRFIVAAESSQESSCCASLRGLFKGWLFDKWQPQGSPHFYYVFAVLGITGIHNHVQLYCWSNAFQERVIIKDIMSPMLGFTLKV